MKLIVLLILAFLGGSLPGARADNGDNPWRDLDPTIRERLAPFLGPPPTYSGNMPIQTRPQSDPSFMSWFNQYYSGESVKPADVYPEYRYNSLPLVERVTAACVLSELKTELLDILPAENYDVARGPKDLTATFIFGDDRSSVIVALSSPQDVTNLKEKIVTQDHGFCPCFCAGPDAEGVTASARLICRLSEDVRQKVWGVRSMKTGNGLHFYQTEAMADRQQVSVHIDFHNPGKDSWLHPLKDVNLGAEHFDLDLVKWNDRTIGQVINSEMSNQPSACGISATELARAWKEDQAERQAIEAGKPMYQRTAKKIMDWITDCYASGTPYYPLFF